MGLNVSEEDEIVSRLEALLSKPSSSAKINDDNSKKKGNISIYADNYKDAQGNFFPIVPLKREDSADSLPQTARSSMYSYIDENQRNSINTTAFGRKNARLLSPKPKSIYTLLPMKLPEDYFGNSSQAEESVDRNQIFQHTNSPIDQLNTNASYKKSGNAPQINPGDVFVKDEVSGNFIGQKSNELVEQWLDELTDNTAESVKKLEKKKSKRNNTHLRAKPTFLKRVQQMQPAQDEAPPAVPVESPYSTRSSLDFSQAKVSRRGSLWKSSYAAKRQLMSKVHIPPRDSSLQDKNLIPSLNQFGLRARNYSSSRRLNSSLKKLPSVHFNDSKVLQISKNIEVPKSGPFNINLTSQNTNSSVSPRKISYPSLSGTSKKPTGHLGAKKLALPHFSSLMKRPRTIRVKRKSVKGFIGRR